VTKNIKIRIAGAVSLVGFALLIFSMEFGSRTSEPTKSAREASGTKTRESNSLKVRRISDPKVNRANFLRQFEEFKVLFEQRNIGSLNPDNEKKFQDLVRGWVVSDPVHAIHMINTLKDSVNREGALIIAGSHLVSDLKLMEEVLSEGLLDESDVLMIAAPLIARRFAGFVVVRETP
jgi:hypothetical protein